jgi:hypothetical protein
MAQEEKFVRGLGLLDSTMIVAGSMIGSGIFIVSADIRPSSRLARDGCSWCGSSPDF